MATKIYVSQIDTANTTGGQAPVGAVILVGSLGPYWSNNSLSQILDERLVDFTGYTGSAGYTGSVGDTGYRGSVGSAGPGGVDGPQGAVGFQGSIGGTGYTGSVGFIGSAGYRGSAGYTGSVGDTGYKGSEGYKGSAGYQGSLGATGYSGSSGSTTPFAFNSLTDVPPTYIGNTFVRVNSTANGIFYDSNVYVTNTVTSDMSFGGHTIANVSIKSVSEIVNNVGTAGGSKTITIYDGNLVLLTLTDPVCIITLPDNTTGLISGKSYSITLVLTQDGTGNRVVDWSPQTVVWPAAEGVYAPDGPTLSSLPDYTDFVTLTTFDAGAKWYGVMSAKGFPLA